MSADPVTPRPIATPKPRRRRWLVRVLPAATLLVLGVWFAPSVVAKTELRNRFARQLLADVRGSVDVGGASLGWFSPVELRDVVIKDEAGRALVTAPKITSRKSLFALARNRAEPGEFTIENPTIAVVCEKNTTNAEAAFAEYLKENPSTAPTRTPVSVKVTGGALTITDAETEKTTRIEGITANATIPANRSEPIALKVTAATGDIAVEASLGDSNTSTLKSAGLALDTFAPLLKRADPGLSLAGSVTTDLRLAWGKGLSGRTTVTIAGTASAKKFALSATELNGDVLRFDSVELPLDVELAGRGLLVRAFDLKCDAGTVSVRGTFDPEESAESLLTRPGLSVSANVEVAKLAAKLPKLLQLKEGIELRDGNLVMKLESKSGEGGTAWEGKVETSALKATRDGKPIVWDKPLHIEFLGQYAKGRFPTFKKLVCTSDFIALNAEVTTETVRAGANVFLDKLGVRLADFVDLRGFTLDGQAGAALSGRRERDGAFRVGATVELKNFAVINRDGKGLTEPALKLEVIATGKAPDGGPVQLATATATLAANGDELQLSLLEPVANVREFSNGSVDVHVTGDLARWKSRVAALVKIPKFDLSGSVDARGRAKLASERVTVDRLAITLTKPKLMRWINLDEPTMNAVGDLTFTRATSAAVFTKLTINSVPLSVTNGTLSFEPQSNGEVVVSGNGQGVADLNRLGKTVKLYADPNGKYALNGRGVGPLRFRYDAGTTTFGGTLDVTNFGYGPKEKFTWFEPALKLDADGSYSDKGDSVTLKTAKVDRPGLTLDANGTLAKITATRDVDFKGTLRYDWEKLTPLVRGFVDQTFTATGTGSRGFVLKGQLPPESEIPAGASILATLTGEAALGWHSVQAFGFDVGAVELNAKMTRGVVSIARIDTTFAGGKAALTPTLDLSTDPGSVTLAKGAVIDRARITTAALGKDGALRFALPAFAGALQADGEFSAAIEDNRFLRGGDGRTTAKGVLLIHRATVSLTPVAARIATVLGAKDTAMTLVNESGISVRVENGRVHHQNFAVRIGGTTLHTNGSVGFDDTLDLVVDVPLPKELPALKNNPVLVKAVSGKVLKVPVKGTLTKPDLDEKAFNAAVIALAREGAKDVGKEVLEGELRKVFPGMPAPGTNPKPGGGVFPFSLPFGKKP